MRLKLVLTTWLFLSCGLPRGMAAEATIYKVLPHYLDKQGRHALAPSLYERDAYQNQLRHHPDQRSGIRFDVQWRMRAIPRTPLKLRLEIRGSGEAAVVPTVLETTVPPPRFFRRWSALTLTGQPYVALGEYTAWRATLWEGDRTIAELTSFLW